MAARPYDGTTDVQGASITLTPANPGIAQGDTVTVSYTHSYFASTDAWKYNPLEE